jgi:hypothetical protein
MTLKPLNHVYDIWEFVDWVHEETGVFKQDILDFVRSHAPDTFANGTLCSITRLSEIDEDYEFSPTETVIYKLIEEKLVFQKNDECILLHYWW